MFSKTERTNDTASAPAAAPGTKGAPSVIAGGMRITGNLTSKGEIQIDGAVDGDISCGRVVVGKEASIHGEIAADHVMVLGSVEGRIRAGTVELEKTARVAGDILHNSLTVAAGAFIDGACKRNEPAATP